jgi:hypothetical protein
MNDTPNSTPTTSAPASNIDYDALAQQAGASSSAAAAAPKIEWVPAHGDPVAHVQTSDGTHLHVHGDDLAELQKRDPNAKVIAPPSPYQPDYDALAKQAGAIQPPSSLTPEQAQSRTLMNMTRAMSGQPYDNPEDEAEGERGRKAGTIQGGIDIAGGFLLGPALEFLGFGGSRAAEEATKQGVKKVGTGILDEYGNEIFKEVSPEAKKVAGKILQHPIVTKAIKVAVKKILGEEAGRRAGKAVGGEAGGYAGATLGALVGDKVLNWILSD